MTETYYECRPFEMQEFKMRANSLRMAGAPSKFNPFYPGLPCFNGCGKMAVEAGYFCSEMCQNGYNLVHPVPRPRRNRKRE